MFLLIHAARAGNRGTKKISIHLMFLLIRDIRSVYDTHVYFNTSHVSINRRARFNQVLVHIRISIHLMFLLIQMGTRQDQDYFYFNTSHVSINQIREKQDPEEVNFNTSHVSINRLNTGNLETAYKYFNTSHVSINLNHV